MRIFAGSDGRVYFQHDDQITSTTVREAFLAFGELADAIQRGTSIERELAERVRERAMPKEVTRELLK